MEAVQNPSFECVAAVTWYVGRLLRFSLPRCRSDTGTADSGAFDVF